MEHWTWIVQRGRAIQTRVPLGLLRANGERLPTRALIAGVLLIIALPALSGLAAALGYPAAALPAPAVVVLGGLQLLVTLYAAIVVVQLAVAAATSAIGKRGRSGAGAATAQGSGRTGELAAGSVRRDLQVLAHSLVELIWERERLGRGALEQAILGVVHDGVSTEIEHRRRRCELERRRVTLEPDASRAPTAGSSNT